MRGIKSAKPSIPQQSPRRLQKSPTRQQSTPQVVTKRVQPSPTRKASSPVRVRQPPKRDERGHIMPIKPKTCASSKNFDFSDTMFARNLVAPVKSTVLFDTSDGVNSLVAQKMAEIKKKRDAEKLSNAAEKAALIEAELQNDKKQIKSKVAVSFRRIDIDKERAEKAQTNIMNFRNESSKNQDTLRIAEQSGLCDHEFQASKKQEDAVTTPTTSGKTSPKRERKGRANRKTEKRQSINVYQQE